MLDYYYWHCYGDLNLKLPPGFFERLLQRGLCAVYFDGYDELAGTVMRDDICKVIENFALIQYPRNRCLLSSRIAGYGRVPLDRKLFTHITLAPFSPAGMESFIRKWYFWKAEEQGLSIRERDEKINDLQTKLKQEQVKLLASNPLLLTMIAIIHRNEARLPEERFRLYEKITEALLQTWEQTKTRDNRAISLGRLRIRLAYVAQWMHTVSDGKEQRQTEVEKGEIETKLTEILQQTEPQRFREDKFKAREEAKSFLEFVNMRAGLLVESGDGLYRFLHLSFQEYFTAYYYNEQDMGASIWEKLYLTHIPKPHYNEVLRLLFTMMVHGGKRKTANAILGHCRARFWELVGINPEEITRRMVIKDVEEVGKRLRAATGNPVVRYLIFARDALSDCLDFECEEKEEIGKSFFFMELYYCHYALFFVKEIKQIQDQNPDYNLARARARDLARARALDLVRALNLNLGLNLNPSKTDKRKVEADLAKMKNNCVEINKKADVFMGDSDKRYMQFLTLVLLLMAFITGFRWWYIRNSLPWNYPELDTFVETAGGLIPGQG